MSLCKGDVMCAVRLSGSLARKKVELGRPAKELGRC
jgi:hypothetical protein